MKYVTVEELKEIVKLCEFLNENFKASEISVDVLNFVDANGERLGAVGMTDGGGYGYILEWDDDVST